ncbi:zinc-binding dehydrogenase [Acidicapsa dinghuensis]|uniref:Zinc-binding dehydrogenase n=1 Tax=Acidicapsa dinghuensis TaxID=2218256 RepID=A0ABW1EGN0_9BACT|nr:alcohol dehydrogenase catalytic domain-containing protein [Acidicapsa dinghuensis]
MSPTVPDLIPTADAATLPKTMTAAVLYGQEDVRIEQVEVPRAKPGELIVRVSAALTCGTDLKVFRRGYHAKMIRPPALFGHELAGIVAEVGEGVSEFAIGDRVVPINSAPCGDCYFCERHQENLCEDLIFNNGAYAEYMRITPRIVEKNTLLAPSDLPLEFAALTEPLACALHGLQDSHPRHGDTVAVIGGGPLGLMLIHAAALYGCRVIAVVKYDAQVRVARALGAEHVVQILSSMSSNDVTRAVRELTPAARGVDIAIEAVARPETWEQAVDMVRNGGVVNFFGGPETGTHVQFDTNRLHYGDLTLKATFHHTPAICREAFHLIASGKVQADQFITGHAPLADLKSAFARLLDRGNDGNHIKTAILPNGAHPLGKAVR